MMQKLGDIVSERALAAFAGRAREVEALLQLLEPGGPLALYVHGVAGIGKSSLLEVFAARVRATGGRVVRIDCRTVEPTVQGFLTELSDAGRRRVRRRIRESRQSQRRGTETCNDNALCGTHDSSPFRRLRRFRTGATWNLS